MRAGGVVNAHQSQCQISELGTFASQRSTRRCFEYFPPPGRVRCLRLGEASLDGREVTLEFWRQSLRSTASRDHAGQEGEDHHGDDREHHYFKDVHAEQGTHPGRRQGPVPLWLRTQLSSLEQC